MSSSSSISSSPTPEPPARRIPQVNLTALARTTRKTLERLVPFAHMRTSSPEMSPKLKKIIDKINHYITLIDSSILCEQLGYQLASNCMVLCDPELSVGLNPSGGNAGVATRGRGGAWAPVGVNGQPGATDVYVFGREDARELASKGYEIAMKVKEGFSAISQEIYKIAASTKDDMLFVLIPLDPTHSENLKSYLKDVGTNLVANLSLLTEFSKAVSEVADWWSSVKDDLASEQSALLALDSPQCADETEKGIGNLNGENFAWWSGMKDDFQEYYDGINGVHLRFPELLPLSIAAWQPLSSTPSQAPDSTGQSDNQHRKFCIGGFRLEWKRVDGEKKEEGTKLKNKLIKRRLLLREKKVAV